MSFKKPPLKNYNKYLLPAGFSIIIFLMIFSFLFASLQIKARTQLIGETANQQNINGRLLSTMYRSVLNRSLTLIEMMSLTEAAKIENLSTNFINFGSEFIEARDEFIIQDLSLFMSRKIEEQTKLLMINNTVSINLSKLIKMGEREKAFKLFNTVTLPKQKLNLSYIKEMIDHQSLFTKNRIKKLQNDSDRVASKILFINLFSVLISIILTFFVLRKQRRSDRKLEHRANTDMLTDLPNRNRLVKTIDWHIKQKPTATFAIIFFDIDNFKTINDNYGHEMGDRVIKKFSNSISSLLNSSDVLARFGGDEFVLLLRSIKTDRGAELFVQNLSKKLDTSYLLNDCEIFITASIGASLYSGSCEKQCPDAKSLLEHADIAMYSAKKAGRNCYRFFSEETRNKLLKEHAIEHALHTTLKNNNKENELFLMYQPLTNISDGNITDCEALIRWKTLKGETIPPDTFIPLAEKTNLIEKINLFVLNEACRQQKEWQTLGVDNVRININLCGNKQVFKNLLEQFKSNIQHLNLPPSLFGIELTERTLNEISSKTIEDLALIRDQGVKISIDDFGTGYSSLSYLKKLPITTLKIDKEFIDGLPDDKDDQALVKTIITLGHSLNLDIVAEGVETVEQFNFLKRHACNTVQGFYFHRPLNSKQIINLKHVA